MFPSVFSAVETETSQAALLNLIITEQHESLIFRLCCKYCGVGKVIALAEY